MKPYRSTSHLYQWSHKRMNSRPHSENLQNLPKTGIKSSENFYNLKPAITDIYDVYLYCY